MHSKTTSIIQSLQLLLSSSILASSIAVADQPSAVFWEYDATLEKGSFQAGITPGGDDRVKVQLTPNQEFFFEDQVLVVFPECGIDPKATGKPVLNLNEIIKDPGISPQYADYEPQQPRWEICPEQNVLLFSAKDVAALELQVDFLRPFTEGMSPRLKGQVYEVPRQLLKKTDDPHKLAQLMGREQPAAELIIDLYYRLNAKHSSWVRGDYELVFGSASDGAKMTRDYDQVKSLMPVNVQGFRSRRPLPELNAKPGFDLPLKRVYQAGSGHRSKADLSWQDMREIADFNVDRQSPVIGKKMMAKTGFSHTLNGRFSTRWTADHSLHPGFGFRVEAWTNETGSWKELASDWVQSNGYWSLDVANSKNYQGNQLRVLYRSFNRYYRPQNENADTYSWRDPDQYNIGSQFDSGHRYADTDGGEYNGIGELVDAAMMMWSRLYWDGGIDPVNTRPVEMNYPNTWNNCGGSSPWSCASQNGLSIWLIPAHGTQADVVVHELAHALQGKFWDEKWPANSGGSHTLSGCYSGRLGMALTEGFANFLPAWVGYPNRNVADGGFSSGRWALDLDIEKRTAPPNCANGWENEVWVARAFWDLHDTHADGDDVLWFIHKGAVISLYLANSVANNGDAKDMRNFETIYRNAASNGHEGYISDIFEQNRM